MRHAAGELPHRIQALRAPQLFLELQPFADVGDAAHHAHGLAVHVAQDEAAADHVAHHAAGAQHAVVLRPGRGPGGHRLLHAGQHAVAVVRVHVLAPGRRAGRAAARAQRLELRVAPQRVLREVPVPDGVVGRARQQREALAALARRALGRLQARQVLEGALHAVDAAALAARGLAADAHPDVPPAHRHHLGLEVERLAGAPAGVERGQHALAVRLQVQRQRQRQRRRQVGGDLQDLVDLLGPEHALVRAVALDGPAADASHAAGDVQQGVARAHRLLGQLALRDVLERALQADDLPARVAHRLADGAHPDAAALDGELGQLELVGRAVARAFGDQRADVIAVLRREQRDALVQRRLVAGRGVVDGAVLVGPGEPVLRQRDRPAAHARHAAGDARQRLAVRELVVGALALGDVHHHAQARHQPALGIEDRPPLLAHPAHRAVGPADAVFGLEQRRIRRHLQVRLPQDLAVLRQDEVHDIGDGALEVRRRDAEQLARGIGPLHFARVRMVGPAAHAAQALRLQQQGGLLRLRLGRRLWRAGLARCGIRFRHAPHLVPVHSAPPSPAASANRMRRASSARR